MIAELAWLDVCQGMIPLSGIAPPMQSTKHFPALKLNSSPHQDGKFGSFSRLRYTQILPSGTDFLNSYRSAVLCQSAHFNPTGAAA